MPNVQGAGLHGWPRELDGSSPRAATKVYAVRPGETEWRLADYVWSWCEQVPGDPSSGSWQIIFAAEAKPPTAVVATWTQPNAVKVDWTLPNPSTASTWIVRRGDGSEVGRVTGNITTLTDPTPRITNNVASEFPTSSTLQYSVSGTDGATESARIQSNVVTVSLDAANFAATVSYPDASTNSTATVTLTWQANPTYGEPDAWRAWNSIAGTWVSGDLPPGTRSWVATSQTRGNGLNYRIVPFARFPDGSLQQAGNGPSGTITYITPNVPQPQSWGPSGISQLCAGFWGPGAGNATDYELEYHDNAWHFWGTTTSGGPHCLSTTAPLYARVRTRYNAGGTWLVSDWANFNPWPAYPVNDATGPGAPRIDLWRPEGSYGRMVVTGAWSADGDTAWGRVYAARIGIDNWVERWSGAVTPGSQCGPFNDGTGYMNGGQGTQMGVLLQCWDSNGNAGAQAVAYYTLEAADQNFDPVDGGTVRNGAWRNDGTISGTMQAFGQTSSGANKGVFFYGPGMRDWCQRRAPGSIQGLNMRYARMSTQGMAAARCPVWYVHMEAYKGGDPGLGGGGDQGNCVAWGESVIWYMPGYFAQWFRDGWMGVANWNPTGDVNSNYGRLYDTGANYGDICGRIWIQSLG